MTARPGNWSLITDDGKDPVDGDPATVNQRVTYYSSMAETIAKEAARLKKLGQDDELVGKYAKSLRDELGDLSDQVDKAQGRYEAVGTALKPFAAALEDARTESWGALQDAVKAHAAQGKADAMTNPQAKPGKDLTAAQKTQQSSRTTAIDNANDDLAAARTRLTNALSALTTAGKKAAEEINDGSNDDLKDHHHWWDVVVKFLKVVVEVLNYVVIALAIAALFVSGLGWIIFAISLVILAIDTALALTGNGSWMDVALDAVGLLTCGVGEAAGKGASLATKSAIKSAAKIEAKEAGREMGLVRRSVTFFSRRSTALRDTEAFAETAGKNASKLSGLRTADREMAQKVASLTKLSEKYPNSAKIANRLAAAQKYAKATRVAGYTGLSTVVTNTALSPSNIPGYENVKPYSTSYNDYKEGYTNEDAGPRAYDFRWNNLDYSPSSLFESAGPRQR